MSELEEEILDKIAREFAQEVDNDIIDTSMINVLKSKGWTETKINPAFGKSIVPEIDWYTETAEWVHLNATGDYKLLKGQWVFEKKEDAVMFTLTWS
jgi:hypothetical protein